MRRGEGGLGCGTGEPFRLVNRMLYNLISMVITRNIKIIETGEAQSSSQASTQEFCAHFVFCLPCPSLQGLSLACFLPRLHVGPSASLGLITPSAERRSWCLDSAPTERDTVMHGTLCRNTQCTPAVSSRCVLAWVRL